jgi:hypothetical protein
MQEGCIPGGKATWLSENPNGKLRHDLFKLISKNEAFYTLFRSHFTAFQRITSQTYALQQILQMLTPSEALFIKYNIIVLT